jgi:hypothetical protein
MYGPGPAPIAAPRGSKGLVACLSRSIPSSTGSSAVVVQLPPIHGPDAAPTSQRRDAHRRWPQTVQIARGWRLPPAQSPPRRGPRVPRLAPKRPGLRAHPWRRDAPAQPALPAALTVRATGAARGPLHPSPAAGRTFAEAGVDPPWLAHVLGARSHTPHAARGSRAQAAGTGGRRSDPSGQPCPMPGRSPYPHPQGGRRHTPMRWALACHTTGGEAPGQLAANAVDRRGDVPSWHAQGRRHSRPALRHRTAQRLSSRHNRRASARAGSVCDRKTWSHHVIVVCHVVLMFELIILSRIHAAITAIDGLLCVFVMLQ